MAVHLLLKIKPTFGNDTKKTRILFGNITKCSIFAAYTRTYMDINQYISTINPLCEQHKVSKLFAFGSVLTNRFNDESDIDLVVDFKDIDLRDYVDNYFSLKDALSDAFGRKIDLLEDEAIRNPVLRRNIDNSKLLIYG